MTAYDAAMIAVVIAGMIWGALRGITWQVASIASLVLGYVVALPVSAQIAPYFPGSPIVARALAMLACYVAVSGGIYLVAWSIRTILKQWKFEAYDRHLGMILGGTEGALLGIVGTLFVLSLAPASRQPIMASTSGKIVGSVLSVAEPALPGELRAELTQLWSDGASVATTDSRPTPSAPEPLDGLIRDEVSRVKRVAAQAIENEVAGPDGSADGAVKRR
jgi:membrane protein required for colicin V production